MPHLLLQNNPPRHAVTRAFEWYGYCGDRCTGWRGTAGQRGHEISERHMLDSKSTNAPFAKKKAILDSQAMRAFERYSYYNGRSFGKVRLASNGLSTRFLSETCEGYTERTRTLTDSRTIFLDAPR